MELLSLEVLRFWPGKAMAGSNSTLRGFPEAPQLVFLEHNEATLNFLWAHLRHLVLLETLGLQDFNLHILCTRLEMGEVAKLTRKNEYSLCLP